MDKHLALIGFAGMMASSACASTSEASVNTSLPSQKHEIFLGEEESPTSVWRRSMQN